MLVEVSKLSINNSHASLASFKNNDIYTNATLASLAKFGI
jgi:hypothetical protein